MAMDLRQTIKLSQQLVMTPQLQQAIKLLQMSRLELVDAINEEMEENPTLEEAMDQEEPSESDLNAAEGTKDKEETTEDVSNIDASENDINWDQYVESYSASDYPARSYEREEQPSYDSIIRQRDTLADHLKWQLQMSGLNESEREIADFIIGNIDEDGYLTASLEEIVQATREEIEKVEKVLKVVQGFDPPGIAARGLKECLLIQAGYLGLNNTLVEEIIKNHLLNLEKRQLQAILKETGAGKDKVAAAVKVISEMEPKPGRPFAEDNAQYIIPDLYIHKMEDDYVIVQNEDGIPRLRVSGYYRDIIKKGLGKGDTKDYIQEKVRSALWLIKSIQQRQRTIYKTMESILKSQKDFFDRGIEYLKPLVLKDVADDIGMHESTISRVTNNKYVQTPHGIFELKYFFNSAISSYGGDDIASESVKEKIRQLISGEDTKKPLSDQAIVNLLNKNDINIARRTVTKYREMMGVPSSSKRKKLF